MTTLIEQRDEGLSLLEKTLLSQDYEILKHPALDKEQANFDERIGLERSRDIYVRKGDETFLIIYNTEAYSIKEFLAKIIAASKMGITVVPVLRKSIETVVADAEPVRLKFDGPFFKRTGKRKSLNMDDSYKTRVIDAATLLERKMMRAVTMNLIPYLQTEHEQHRYGLRLFSTEEVTTGYLKLGHTHSWAWSHGPAGLAKRFLLTFELNPKVAQEFKPMQLYMTEKEKSQIIYRFSQISQSQMFKDDAELAELVKELSQLERINTGTLVPTKLSWNMGFPLLYMALRYCFVNGNETAAERINKAISVRGQNLYPSPTHDYELGLWTYHSKEAPRFKR